MKKLILVACAIAGLVIAGRADILPPPDPPSSFKNKPTYQVVDGKLGFWFPGKFEHLRYSHNPPVELLGQERWEAYADNELMLQVYKDYSGYWESVGPNDQHIQFEVLPSRDDHEDDYHVEFLTYERPSYGNLKHYFIDAVITLRDSSVLYHIWGYVWGAPIGRPEETGSKRLL